MTYEPVVLIYDVQLATCERYGISLDDLRGRRSRKALSRPRQVAMYLARWLTGRSYRAIG